MKKFTFTLMAAFLAVVAFAAGPKEMKIQKSATRIEANLKKAPARQLTPKPAPTHKVNAPANMARTMKTRTSAKAPRKAGITDLASLLQTPVMLLSNYYDTDDKGNLIPAAPAAGGWHVTISNVDQMSLLTSGTTTFSIENFTNEATEPIQGTLTLGAPEEYKEQGFIATITIADGQELLTDEDLESPVILCNAIAEGEDMMAYIHEDGYAVVDGLWYTSLTEGDYAGYMYNLYIYESFIEPANGTMTWTNDDGDNEEYVYIEQDEENPKTVTVYNFGGLEVAIDITLDEDKTFVIDSQLVEDGGEEYGQFYTYGLNDEENSLISLTGIGTETTLTFDCKWTAYAESGYWYGAQGPAIITITDGKFAYPVISDVAAMPANPKILKVIEYDAAEGYGAVIINVPSTDADGNDIKKSKLFYQLYAEVDGEVQPITFTPEFYENLTENLSIIPYKFTDNYDFQVISGDNKYVYMNFEFNYDRIGIKSIYEGGNETNETEIQWYVADYSGDHTFDFNAMTSEPVSNSSTAGDITENREFKSNGIILTVSPAAEGATTANRFWKDRTNGVQLRVYSGTLTFEAPEGYLITQIVFNASKWDEGNNADSGEFDGSTWTGNANQVVVTIAGNTQLNSIVVTVVNENQLVVLPEGVEAEAWTMEGFYNTDEGGLDVVQETEVAIDGTDIYVKGLAYYFEDAWLKGTIDEDGIATFASGQFVGEDEYGKEYMIGYNGNTICDIQFLYDAEAKKLAQLTPIIIENDGTKTEMNPYGYWTNVIFYAGDPIVIDPVQAPEDLVTEAYIFKANMLVETGDEQEPYSEKGYETTVQVGFDGDDLYIQGISEYLPEGWIKATKNAEGLYIIPAKQYIGFFSYQDYPYDCYFAAINEETYELDDVALSYDSNTKSFTTEQVIVVNGSKFQYNPYEEYYNVVITKDDSTAVADVNTADNSKSIWHNLNGVRIEKPVRKGIYLHNGKKLVVK